MCLLARRGNGRARGGRLLAQELLDARDRLVDRLIGGEAVDDDPVNRLRPNVLLVHQTVPPLARGDLVAVKVWSGQELHGRGHAVRVARVEPERLLEQRRHRWEEAIPGEV